MGYYIACLFKAVDIIGKLMMLNLFVFKPPRVCK